MTLISFLPGPRLFRRGLFALLPALAAALLIASCRAKTPVPLAPRDCVGDPKLKRALQALGGSVIEIEKLPSSGYVSYDRVCDEGESFEQCSQRAAEDVRAGVPLTDRWTIESEPFPPRSPEEAHVRRASVKFRGPRRVIHPMVRLLWTTDAPPEEAERRLSALQSEVPRVSVAARPELHPRKGSNHYGLKVDCTGEEQDPDELLRYCTQLGRLDITLTCEDTLDACETQRTATILYNRALYLSGKLRPFDAPEERAQQQQDARPLREDPFPCKEVPKVLCRAVEWQWAGEPPRHDLYCYTSRAECETAERGSLSGAAWSSACEYWR